ncbi:OB-fold-containig protein [Novosphingobium resinovorum]
MVEPHDDADAIPSGETALLVRREGQVFFAVPDRPASLRLP